MSRMFTRYRVGHGRSMPDTPPQTWPPGLLFRRWEGSKALPGSPLGALTRPPEHTNYALMAPREATKASKNYVNRSLLHLNSLQIAIALHEETEMTIQGQYLKTIGDEINSSKSKATLATLARHFRLQRLNGVLIEIVEMESELERWHKTAQSKLPQNYESCVQNSTKKLEEVSTVLHNKWVSNKAVLDAHYCLKDGKHLETKIAQLHDSVEETMKVLYDLAGKMYECHEEYTNVPEMPFSKLSIHKKIIELPGKYVVVQC